MASLAGNNFVREKEKYSLAEKKALGELISKYKEKYDKEKEELQGKTRYDKKRKRHVQIKPQQQGFLAAAVREFYPDLSEVKHNDTNLVKALKFAKRCHEKYLSNDFEVEQPSAKKFRESGAGRKFKAPEVREAMFEWFINVRGVLKGRLPIKMFRTRCQQVYSDWLKQQPEPIPEEEQLKFSKCWINDWMKEYNVSLRKPNKRFAIKNEDRIIRIKDYLQNIWLVRKYFLDTYGIEPPIINGDQMPLHRNESASQKTLSFKSEATFVKENYMLSRERVTCFTQLCSDPKVSLKPEFVFKGKGTRTHLTPPQGVNYQWAPKGSYRIEQILGMIKQLPNRYNMFTEKGYAIYVLDDYSVHLMPEVRQALLKKGYILVIIGGGITGDIQINDTNCHRDLKKYYREFEMELMLDQLKDDPKKIPSPSRNDMMRMLLRAWDLLDVDTEKEFKSLFVTNALDGSEDYLVSDKLYTLVGNDMVRFRKELMSSRPIKTLKEVIKKLIPPKGVKRKGNDEGMELFDCEEEEILLEELEQECDDELHDDNDVREDENVEVEENHEQSDSTASSSTQRKNISLKSFTTDPEIKKDAEFLDKFQAILEDSETSKMFIPYISQFRATFQKARRSIKKRIETKESTNSQHSNKDSDSSNNVEATQPTEPIVQSTESVAQSTEPADQCAESVVQSKGDETILDASIDGSNEEPDVDQYWEISNGKDSMYAQVIEKDPFMVKFFEPTSRRDTYRLNDLKFEILLEDFVKKVQEPQLVAVGRSRVNYIF